MTDAIDDAPQTGRKPASTQPVAPATDPGEARVAKVMSRAGLCSRRDAEAWIRAGRVAINGAAIDSPARNIGPGDIVTVDGYPIDKAERTRLFLFHKTRGLVTTEKDPEGRPTVFDALPTDLPRVMTIGRLDINTEGLLLLTNDGGLARLLELPATGWVRRYRVRAKGTIDQPALDALREGLTLDGVDYVGIEAVLDRVQGANVWLTMGLREGKNREIKRVLEHLGLAVNRLIRLSFGPFQLGDLEEGAVEEIKTRVLRDQLGADLARRAGVDLEGPVTAAVVTREVRYEKAARPTAPGGRERGDRGSSRAAVPAREEHAPRPHVSSLRSARQEAEEGPRRRTERGATADRKGRAVAVERVTAVARPRPAARPATRPAAAAPASRNARRFEAERQEVEPGRDARPARARTFGAGRSSSRTEGDGTTRGRLAGGRVAESAGREERPARRTRDGRDDAAPRRTTRTPQADGDRRPRPERRGDAERPSAGRPPRRNEGTGAAPGRDDRASFRRTKGTGAGPGGKPARAARPGAPGRSGPPASKPGGRPGAKPGGKPGGRPGAKPGGRGRPRT